MNISWQAQALALLGVAHMSLAMLSGMMLLIGKRLPKNPMDESAQIMLKAMMAIFGLTALSLLGVIPTL